MAAAPSAGFVRLRHDHRHADGNADALSSYGGDSTRASSASRQEFPVDADSIAVCKRSGGTASSKNALTIEVEPGRRVAYELSRPDGRLFREAFDLTRPVAMPPAPWGG
ncbi:MULTISPECIES: hypothetical protein [unclassified Xanthomonas]|uniref:hypothetical protein n=1 Tax=unclassified Xanthomonas TaxID=2643310 RepID=UPI002169541E|nr:MULTISPECIES: hypothetical protein [unclassified Xanthomonas]MCS3745574.1 hypothetical protein [Xanthomonas sp. 3793]MCS3807878.1 hypothetical protein [Xanthomonas sp. 4461]